uniref:Ig-like domain-containing protein n=1 Tax=Latimeria chalumnae TaxID=7897 RepID=H3A0Z5_LATCH
MSWIPCIAMLILCWAGPSAQFDLTQSSSQTVSPGHTAKLSCTISGSTISNHRIYWLQHRPGNPPRYLLYYKHDSEKHQGSGVPARFSGSTDNPSNTGILTISSVEAEDEADYYCLEWDNSRNAVHTVVYVFGKGTKLNVQKESSSVPLVSLLPPSLAELTDKNRATLVCLVNNFSPGSVEVTWTVDGVAQRSGIQTSLAQKQNENTYSVSSFLTLPVLEWNSKNIYTCEVKHQNKMFQKTLKKSECN